MYSRIASYLSLRITHIYSGAKYLDAFSIVPETEMFRKAVPKAIVTELNYLSGEQRYGMICWHISHPNITPFTCSTLVSGHSRRAQSTALRTASLVGSMGAYPSLSLAFWML